MEGQQANRERPRDDREAVNPDNGSWLGTVSRWFFIYSIVNLSLKAYVHVKGPALPNQGAHLGGAATELELVDSSGPSSAPSQLSSLATPAAASAVTAGATVAPRASRLLHHHPFAGLPAVRSVDGEPLDRHWCLWQNTTKMDLRVFVTSDQVFDHSKFSLFPLRTHWDSEVDHGLRPKAPNAELAAQESAEAAGPEAAEAAKQAGLIWHLKDLALLPQSKDDLSRTLNVTVSPELVNNGSAWAHVFLSMNSATTLDPHHPDFDHKLVTWRSWQLTKHKRANPRGSKVVSLLGGDSDSDSDGDGTLPTEAPVINYWTPSLSVRVVASFGAFKRGKVPSSMSKHMSFDYASGAYFPILYNEEFWTTAKDLIRLGNESHVFDPAQLGTHETAEPTLPLRLEFGSIALMKWQLQSQLEEQWRAQEELGLAKEGESDGLRKLLIETQPWLIGVTILVSVLHSVFSLLAFRSDVAFYRQRKDFTGISLRSLVLNSFFQTVILLYLLDSDSTSWLVCSSNALGLLIEYWKVAQAVKVNLERVTHRDAWGFLGWRLKEDYSESASATKTYDKVATDHILYLVAPLVVGYSCFSLVHSKYKSWYSWLLSSLVGFIYTFGFVMMTPQLFINYKLKSTAHLPWKAMIYKSINTFIDDLFAFVVPMPTLHRIGCLRDDLIFLVFLYQRWIYPIDKTRVNEFGQQFELTEEEKKNEIGEGPQKPEDERDE